MPSWGRAGRSLKGPQQLEPKRNPQRPDATRPEPRPRGCPITCRGMDQRPPTTAAAAAASRDAHGRNDNTNTDHCPLSTFCTTCHKYAHMQASPERPLFQSHSVINTHKRPVEMFVRSSRCGAINSVLYTRRESTQQIKISRQIQARRAPMAAIPPPTLLGSPPKLQPLMQAPLLHWPRPS